MLFAKDFRRIAREALKGKWILAVLVCIVAYFLGANPVMSEGGTSFNYNIDEETTAVMDGGTFDEAFWAIVLPIITGIAVIAVIYVIVVLIIGGAVTLGYCKFNLGLMDKKNPQFMDLFSGFDRFGAGFCVQFLRGLYTFLWSLLFLIPGIIASYRYAMSAYILSEHPEMTASEAIEASKKMMVGNKWRLFCLSFSFIGWDILCMFTAGIGFLVLNPYKEAAYAAFYREVSGTWKTANCDNTAYDHYEQTNYESFNTDQYNNNSFNDEQFNNDKFNDGLINNEQVNDDQQKNDQINNEQNDEKREYYHEV